MSGEDQANSRGLGRICGPLLLPGLESRWNPQNSGLPRNAGIVSQLLERNKDVQAAGVGSDVSVHGSLASRWVQRSNGGCFGQSLPPKCYSSVKTTLGK